MQFISPRHAAVALLSVTALVGCDGRGGAFLSTMDSGATSPSARPVPAAPIGAQSVGDVIVPSGRPSGEAYASQWLSAKVYNETDVRAAVTLRFARDGQASSVTLLEVLPLTATLTDAPRRAREIGVTGVDAVGKPLASARYTFGVDFDEQRAAVYRIRTAMPDPKPDDPVETPAEDPYTPPTIELSEPAHDVALALGLSLHVKWRDESPSGDAIVLLGVRASGDASARFISLAQALPAAADGSGDEANLTLQGLAAGRYDVVAFIDDGRRLVEAKAPGRVDVFVPTDNEIPTLDIVEPPALSEIRIHDGGALRVVWQDADADDNATISFALIGSALDTAVAGVRRDLATGLSEDADGDSASFVVAGLAPGRYDLVGSITDGKAQGFAHRDGVVVIESAAPAPDPANVPPTFQFAAGPDVNAVGSGPVTASWTDSDPDNNAAISFYLERNSVPFLNPLDPSAIPVTSGIEEDADGAGGQFTFSIHADVAGVVAPPGSIALPPWDEYHNWRYRLVAVVDDGTTRLTVKTNRKISAVEPPPSQSDDDTAILITEPSADLTIHLGDPLHVVYTGIEHGTDAEVRFFLSNEWDGGTIRVELPIDSYGPPRETPEAAVILSTLGADIANSAGPRLFELQVKATGTDWFTEDTAPGKVCLYREIDVIPVGAVTTLCPATRLALRAVGDPPPTVRIGLTSGGCSVNLDDGLEFWLSGDRTIPLSGEQDATHRKLNAYGPGGNSIGFLEIGIDELVGLSEGAYYLISVSTSGGPAAPPRFTVLASGIEVCRPIP